jgi:hypothetical protein
VPILCPDDIKHFTLSLCSRIEKRKPLLTARHRSLWLQFARDHLHWNTHQWRMVFFTNETPIPLIQSNQRCYVRVLPGESYHIRPKVQAGGGKIMIWGGFSALGITALSRPAGSITSEQYISTLEEHAEPLNLQEKCITFQQDNTPAHKSRRKWIGSESMDMRFYHDHCNLRTTIQ